MSQLQHAVKKAILDKNIDLIYPEFMQADFFVIVGSGDQSFACVKTADDRWTVTVSENQHLLPHSEPFSLIRLTGKALFEKLQEHVMQNIGITICFDDGGYYLDHTQLAWFEQLIEDG